MKGAAGRVSAIALLIFGSVCVGVRADGNSVGKIYDPYVQLLEQEVEYRSLFQWDGSPELDDRQRYSLGYGRAFSDRFFGEAYLIGHQGPGDSLNLDAVELELKWQLSEQGEFDNDWGLLLELERDMTENRWEAGTGLILLHEWPSWVATANFSAIYEWGEGIDEEFETRFAGQLKYRYRQALEPAIELFLSQNTRALGPVLTGALKLGRRQKLHWDAGLLLGLDIDTPNTTLRIGIEYEF